MELNDPEGSWQAFLMLEGFADGNGGWNFLQVFGHPVMELDDALISDLLVWRNMAAIARKEKDRIESEKARAESDDHH